MIEVEYVGGCPGKVGTAFFDSGICGLSVLAMAGHGGGLWMLHSTPLGRCGVVI